MKSAKELKSEKQLRLLIFIVAYNANRTIGWVLSRIPATLLERYELEVLIIDDASADDTFGTAEAALQHAAYGFRTKVLRNPVNQGYGGNQKLGFQYAIDNSFDVVALVHGDGQYAPECLPDLLAPIEHGEADAVFGSRMLESGQALKGGMPLYKFIGNRILTTVQNHFLRARLSEFHSGYRLYTTAGLRMTPFHLNSNDFHFDTQIIIQFLTARLRIREVPIPTYYGDEICHVDGLRYAWNVFCTTLKARCQDYGLFYERAFDCAPTRSSPYESKLNFPSPHHLAINAISSGERVADLGGGNGVVAQSLAGKGAIVTIYDSTFTMRPAEVACVIQDLNHPLPEAVFTEVDTVLMLDVIEHLSNPEQFVESLRSRPDLSRETRLIASTGNVAFFLTRLSMTFGMFNYGKRGILDLTHRRLFTISSFCRLFEQAGFEVLDRTYVPGPFPLAFGDGLLGRVALALNKIGCRLAPGLFAYQIVVTLRKLPTLDELLLDAHSHSAELRGPLRRVNGDT